MSFLYFVLLGALYVYNLNQLLELSGFIDEEEEVDDSNNHNLPNRFNLTRPSSSENEVTSESVPPDEFSDEFVNPENTIIESCAVAVFAVRKTVKVKNGVHFVLRKESLINGVLVFEHYLLTSADLVQNVSETLVLKTAKDIVRVSRIFIINGTNIAVLKLCRKVISIPSCRFAREPVCPKSTCSAIPPTITSDTFIRGGVIEPRNTISHIQGTSIQCPEKQSSSCCFTSSQTRYPGYKGAGVFSGSNVIGIITGKQSSEAKYVNYFTPIEQEIQFKIYHAITLSLDCENCANMSGRLLQRI